MRSSKYREVRVALGNAITKIPVSTNWRRYVVTLTPTKNSNTALVFNVGREETHVWLDSVYLFEGDTNVFSREFENGIVLANATATSKTINVGSNFRRILGTQDAVNNGNDVTSVTLAPYDGIVLVRREGAGSGGSGGGGSGGGGSGGGGSGGGSGDPSGGGLIGDQVWRDVNGNGLMDASESGWAGLTIKLRNCGSGAVITSRKTNIDGRYEFAGLAPGDYEVLFPQPAGTTFSPLSAGGDAPNSSDADPATGLSWCVRITAAGEQRRSVDAGIIPAN
jgi:hypothetical protein